MDWNRISKARPMVAEAMEKDLALFCKNVWPIVHPGSKLRWNWHLDLICEYLTLVKRGQCKRLMILVPPRTAKTTVASICFPVWAWLTTPALCFLCASYELDLSSTHNLARRQLISSQRFQSFFKDRFQLTSDRSLVQEFTNSAGGMMLSASVNSRAMGRGGDIVVVDDPLSADAAFSDILRNETNSWFTHMLPQRLNSPSESPIILIQQRLHQSDPAGDLLEREAGEWTLVKLPLIAEEDETWTFPISGRVVVRKKGECLDPKRFTPKVVRERQRNRLIWASQFQQEPAPLEGNMIRTADILFYGGRDPKTGERDPELPADFDRRIISVDCAFKDKSTSDFVAIIVIGVRLSRRYVLHITNARLDLDGTESEIRHCHALYGPVSATLVEDKANGSAIISHLTENISGVIAVNPQGGKLARLMATAPEFQAHNWFVDRSGPWTNKFIEQLTMFPQARHDDIADAVSQAAIWLQANTYEYGLVDYFKGVAAGLIKPRATQPVPVREESRRAVRTRVEGWERWQRDGKAPPCHCGSTNTSLMPDQDGCLIVFCKQCGRRDDGKELPKPAGECCDRFLPQTVSGQIRCGNCGRQTAIGTQPTNGTTFAQYKNLRDQGFANGKYGRFG
jgi:predicted phage terminase large subunit-like protein